MPAGSLDLAELTPDQYTATGTTLASGAFSLIMINSSTNLPEKVTLSSFMTFLNGIYTRA